MKLLVFQHIDCEHPGILREFLTRRRLLNTALSSLTLAMRFTALEDYDALWVMGGPMDVWDIEEHPWLVPEKRAIRRLDHRAARLGDLLSGPLLREDVPGKRANPARTASSGFAIRVTSATTNAG